MTFSGSLLAVCFILFLFLFVYILVLLRSGKLVPAIAVKWVFLEFFAGMAILCWGGLPFIRFTATLSDREMLVVLACIFFVFFSLLIIECMTQTSKHTNQIRRLTQELALLKLSMEEKNDVR